MKTAWVIAAFGLLVVGVGTRFPVVAAQASEIRDPLSQAPEAPVRLEDLGIVLPQPIVVPRTAPKPQNEAPPPLTKEEEKAAELARYGEWCGGPRDLEQCTDSIIYLDQEIRRRESIVRRTKNPNNMGNLGLAIAGCPEYCRMRYFPSDSPEECKETIATFQRMARIKPYLRKSDFRQSLTDSCGKF